MCADGAVGLELAAYKAGAPLAIVPVLNYAIYLGDSQPRSAYLCDTDHSGAGSK